MSEAMSGSSASKRSQQYITNKLLLSLYHVITCIHTIATISLHHHRTPLPLHIATHTHTTRSPHHHCHK